ncbi:hypothetical protein NHH03_27710 [Stieleria sp. TO1_6]|uniref:hypothetical protein n=1 Tax=Stieleria tagensis TaxID=2956795 RepID=UPI00209B6E5A|nr:hypothetical protein [Stieleria tagensis]MCO8125557.1 hypothetical protein [Stieleria tagensis]
MRSLKLAFIASTFLAIAVAAYVHTARANQLQDTASDPSRLIGFLPKGTVIDLSFSNGITSVKILERDYVEQWEANAAKVKRTYESVSNDQPTEENRLAGIEQTLKNLTSPWKVTAVAENYVRLEPILDLPFHEKTPWVILPESSISYIKPR